MMTSKLSPRKSKKIVAMHLWKVAGALHSPNDMCPKAKVPNEQVNVVFS